MSDSTTATTTTTTGTTATTGTTTETPTTAGRPTTAGTPGTDAAPTTTPAPFVGISGLHHLQLAIPAGSEDACRAFWVGLLGLTEVAKPAPMAARGTRRHPGPGFELHVGVTADFAPASKAHPALLVDGLDALAGRLTAAGRPVTWAHDFPGHRHFYVADPVGNRVEFLAPVPQA